MRAVGSLVALIVVVLVASLLPLRAQPAPGGPCNQIKTICEEAGFVAGAFPSGNGLDIDCIRPIIQRRPQRPEASRPLPPVDPQLVAACHAANPSFGEGPLAPQPPGAGPAPQPPGTGPGAGPGPAAEEYQLNGDTYGWFEDGWNGAGWYVVGFEFRSGLGFGGREGWHGWTHHGSHGHRDGGHHDHDGHRHDGDHHGDHHGSQHAGGHHGGSHKGGHSGSHHGSSHHGTGHKGGSHGGGKKHSDIRLKHDIVLLGRLANGLGFYRFSYNGDDKVYVGVMAQEVLPIMPDAVSHDREGYLLVDYDRLGLRLQTWDEWMASGQRIPAIPTVLH